MFLLSQDVACGFVSLLSSASTYSLSSRALRTEGCFVFRPGGGALVVAVFAFLEQVWEAGDFEELKTEEEEGGFLY